MRHAESNIQKQCVRWFRTQYPHYAKLLFAVGNGGARSKIEAAIMIGEGVTPGVADLIFLKANDEYSALCIEMKSAKGSLTKSQKEWRDIVGLHGSRYVICRDVYEFKVVIDSYIKNKKI